MSDENIETRAEKMTANFGKMVEDERAASASEGTVYISIDDFAKVRLQVGEVVEAERVEGSKGGKMLKLTVDFGESTRRTVLSGIGLTFAPEQLVGRQYAFVTNLPPRKMMGIESQAMILATGNPDKLTLMQTTNTATKGGVLG